MVEIRDEHNADVPQIRDLIVEAFAASEFGHNGEAELVESLRADAVSILSQVAVEQGNLVGHIFYSPVELVDKSGRVQLAGMGLAPMSVSPRHQKQGIGSQLINKSLSLLADRGCPFVVVLGQPEYYPRFGFTSASEYGIVHGFSGIPQDLFFIRFPDLTKAPNPKDCVAVYSESFGPQSTSIEQDGTG